MPRTHFDSTTVPLRHCEDALAAELQLSLLSNDGHFDLIPALHRLSF